MVINKFAPPKSQCEVANMTAGSCGIPGNCCNNLGSCNQVCETQIEKAGLNYQHSAKISHSVMKGDIDKNRPVLYRFTFSSGGAHYMVVSGYSSPSLILVNDPNPLYGKSWIFRLF